MPIKCYVFDRRAEQQAAPLGVPVETMWQTDETIILQCSPTTRMMVEDTRLAHRSSFQKVLNIGQNCRYCEK